MASSRVKDFAERKRLLVLQAELHRELVRFEHAHLQQRVADTRDRFRANRWWLTGGALVAGWLFTRRMPRVTRWLPVAVPVWRVVQDFLARPAPSASRAAE